MCEMLIKGRQPSITLKQCLQLKCQSNNLSLIFKDVSHVHDKIISVELCPERALNMEELEELSPAFCSITWHNPSEALLQEIPKIPAISLSKQLSLRGNHVLLHLTGRHLQKSQAIGILEELRKINVWNIFVLQGEPSKKHEGKSDFQFASDLVKFIKRNYGNCFCIGVAAYAKTDPLSQNASNDLKYLKMKVNSGADFIITQMFFDSDTFSGFYQECRQAGITVPIIPGVFIISSYESFISMTTFCKVQIPKDVTDVLSANKANPEAIRHYGIFQCSELIKQLFAKPDMHVIGVHFFSLNNITLVKKVCQVLGLCDDNIERPI